MRHAELAEIVESRLAKIRDSIKSKNATYAPGADALHNFKLAAAFQQTTPERALIGMFAKHLISLLDMTGTGNYDAAMIDEKLGDAINYLVLLEAVMRESKGIT